MKSDYDGDVSLVGGDLYIRNRDVKEVSRREFDKFCDNYEPRPLSLRKVQEEQKKGDFLKQYAGWKRACSM